ncbi:MAG: NYN domain-containing protein, partial [Candidatus Thiodiazotropha sp. (ex Lucinoma kastoroae)]|nr:NYN domain-containing protein [Candidatus Thiodiazotropha sp. (ex Lucinoma kastoroae)]
MRTIIYVDGFNLYYAALTKSAHKWLDIHELFSRKVVKSIQPSSEVIQIKFFTAPILGGFASDPNSPNRQMRYHNALRSRYPELIKIVEGYHTKKETNAYRENPSNGGERIK